MLVMLLWRGANPLAIQDADRRGGPAQQIQARKGGVLGPFGPISSASRPLGRSFSTSLSETNGLALKYSFGWSLSSHSSFDLARKTPCWSEDVGLPEVGGRVSLQRKRR